MTPRVLSATVAVLAFVLPAVSACTGVRIREFTRESYEPGAVLESQARVFAAPRKRVFDVLVASLEDVIRSKAAAGREKDRLALPRLRRLLDRLQGNA